MGDDDGESSRPTGNKSLIGNRVGQETERVVLQSSEHETADKQTRNTSDETWLRVWCVSVRASHCAPRSHSAQHTECCAA